MSYLKEPNRIMEPPPASWQASPLAALASNPEGHALFLDIDGTLLDLAETPDGIIVPPSLPFQLDALSRNLGGALALVTGRGLLYADQLFAPFHFPIAGLHGAERRNPDGTVEEAHATPAFETLKNDLATEIEGWDGVLIEDKGAAVAAHYRLSPEREPELETLMERALARAGAGWKLQRGKMVIEIRPASADKGHAIEAFLEQPPFKGRKPIAIGDDVTDEAMFRVVNRMNGISIRVGNALAETEARSFLASPAALRQAIETLAG
jgi:trehalose 6-phosphate phosphatase